MKHFELKPKTRKISILLLIFAVVAVLMFAFFKSIVSNSAQEVVSLLEKALIGNGAIKKCDQGDNGRGSDNIQPWYTAYYEIAANKEQALGLLNKTAEANGYKLVHGQSGNTGDRYFDHTSKKNPYTDLEDGSIHLDLDLYNDGPFTLSHIACRTKDPVNVNSDADHTAIKLNVALPNRKR